MIIVVDNSGDGCDDKDGSRWWLIIADRVGIKIIHTKILLNDINI